MATLSYATDGIAPEAYQTGLTATLKDGSSITFNISNTAGSSISVYGATTTLTFQTKVVC